MQQNAFFFSPLLDLMSGEGRPEKCGKIKPGITQPRPKSAFCDRAVIENFSSTSQEF
jgi:hypothetical protein